LSSVEGKTIVGFRRIGKRVVFELQDELFMVFHLMIAGRFHLKPHGSIVPNKVGLLALDFPEVTLMFTEAGTKKRASLHVVRGESALEAFDRGGIEPLNADLNAFTEALKRENRTLKRALTDPRIFSGIGNAYSDEILHRAKLSPVKRTSQLAVEEIERLWQATPVVLREWTDELRREVGSDFPEKVTAFRKNMAVHGRYGQPCPVCGTKVQRIVHASNESNYCPRCQTGGRLLADRALSRLLKEDWPSSIEELEEFQQAAEKTRALAPSGAKDAAKPAKKAASRKAPK
jgi:formamidopyrimidine-DNA glycosylase